jgi:hypothetical protein
MSVQHPIDGRQVLGPRSALDRRPGPTVAFAELMGARVVGAPQIMAHASRLYTASAQDGVEQLAWESLSVATVRTWVRVAREAWAIHRGDEHDRRASEAAR